jgi:hypothetical protein
MSVSPMHAEPLEVALDDYQVLYYNISCDMLDMWLVTIAGNTERNKVIHEAHVCYGYTLKEIADQCASIMRR